MAGGVVGDCGRRNTEHRPNVALWGRSSYEEGMGRAVQMRVENAKNMEYDWRGVDEGSRRPLRILTGMLAHGEGDEGG